MPIATNTQGHDKKNTRNSGSTQIIVHGKSLENTGRIISNISAQLEDPVGPRVPIAALKNINKVSPCNKEVMANKEEEENEFIDMECEDIDIIDQRCISQTTGKF